MTISFNSVPSNIRIPFAAVEFDSSRAAQGPALLNYRVLLIGQKTSSGTGTANTLHLVSNADAVKTLAGRGSQLHRMAMKYFANNQATETWVAILADNGSGVAASGNIAITGPSTAAGTLHLYVAGDYVPVAVTSGQSAASIATAVVATLTAGGGDLPTTHAVDGSNTYQVNFTAKNAGTAGNDVDIRVNNQTGQALPAGVGVTVTSMTSGATNPSLTSLIAAMGDTWYNVIAHPYTDSTSLTALETELASRAGPMRQIDGVAITSAKGSLSTLTTLGLTRNSKYSSILAQPTATPATPPAEFAAAAVGVVALDGSIDPARPFQTLELAGVVAPSASDVEFTNTERNSMLYDGIATTREVGGVVQLDRLITTYQTNAAGTVDDAYLDVNTVLTLMYLRYSFRNWISTRYARAKLVDDGTRAGPGQAIITPQIAKGEALSWFTAMEEEVLVEDYDSFKANLVVERDPVNRTRLNFLLPPNLANQFIVAAAQIQFRL